ncbi:MAG: hypothetical protein U0269_36370 [Polyangiales bacterium]
MNRSIIAFAVAAALATSSSLALASDQNEARSEDVAAMLRPGEGRVAVTIRVTETRSVFVRENVIADAAGRASESQRFRFVCHTPCRLYVRPGAVDVALVGWRTNYYQWNIPARGGALNLLARRPDGTLTDMPRASSSVVEVVDNRRAQRRVLASNAR